MKISVVLVLACVVTLIFFTAPSTALNEIEMSFDDAIGDVLDQNNRRVDHPDVDIIRVEANMADDMVKFVLHVHGVIRVSDTDHTYTFYVMDDKTTSPQEAVFMVAFKAGDAYYVDISDHSRHDIDHDVHGSELVLYVPSDVFAGMSSFYLYTMANYISAHSTRRAYDTAYSWQEPPENGHHLPPDDNGDTPAPDDDTPWLGFLGLILAFSLSFALVRYKDSRVGSSGK